MRLENFWSQETRGNELEIWGALECEILNVEVLVGAQI